MHRCSADQVDPNDRFDCWHEVRAEEQFGVTAELAWEPRPNCTGEFLLRRIGTASPVELRAPPYTVERSAADIANVPGDGLCTHRTTLRIQLKFSKTNRFFSEKSGLCANARANIRKISECQGGLSGRPLTHHGMNQANILMPKWLGTAG